MIVPEHITMDVGGRSVTLPVIARDAASAQLMSLLRTNGVAPCEVQGYRFWVMRDARGIYAVHDPDLTQIESE